MNLPRNGRATTQACAACKYQRKKCVPDCILAPYFPHDHQTQFLYAHKLFGVSNITKIIQHLDPLDKDEAMRSIIFQSHVRAADPVGGCYRIICDLQTQIEYSRTELDLVLQQLATFRAQPHQQNPPPHHPPQMCCDSAASVNGGDHNDHNFNSAYDHSSLYNPAATFYHNVPQPQQRQYGSVQHSRSNSNDNSQSQVEDPNSWIVRNTVPMQGNSAASWRPIRKQGTLKFVHSSKTEHPRFDIADDFEMWSDEGVSFKLEDGVIRPVDDSSHQVQDHEERV